MGHPFRVRALQLFACYWPGIVLISLFASTTQEGARHFIAAHGLWTYLALWFLAVSPSIIAAFVASRMNASSTA